MNQTYYTIITKQGAALLANATALGVPLKITQMAVGDGNGKIPKPDANQTKLVHEVRRAAINTLFVDKENPNQIIAEQVIPESDGGWFIHEISLFDDKGNLIAVGNCPATYKPKLAEGSGRTQVIRMVIIVDNAQSIQLKIDPAVVLATRQYVDDLITVKMTAHEKSTNHPNATTKSKGFVQLNSAIDSNLENQAATPLAVKTAYDVANGAVKKTGDTMFGQLVLSELGIKHRYIDSENLMVSRTYDDNYAHIFYDANKKQWLDKLIYNSTTNTWSFRSVDDVIINDKSVLNSYVPVGVPLPWPQVYPPAGYFECNGSAFNKNQFPKLAAAYPGGYLPDLRGEFIRGWDNGRGADPGRGILSWQQDAIRNIYAEFMTAANPVFASGAFYTEGRSNARINSSMLGGNQTLIFNASRVVPVSHDNHPRSIAFMYIVKAE